MIVAKGYLGEKITDAQQKNCIFKGVLNLMLTMNYYMPINNLAFTSVIKVLMASVSFCVKN